MSLYLVNEIWKEGKENLFSHLLSPHSVPVFHVPPFPSNVTLLSSTSPCSHLPLSVSSDAFSLSSLAHLGKQSGRTGGEEGVEHLGPSSPKRNQQHVKELTVILTEIPDGKKLFFFINVVTNQPIHSEGIKLNPTLSSKSYTQNITE